MVDTREITLRVNGTAYTRRIEARMSLADFLRQELGLTGTHIGCEHGVCGACTVLVEGRSARSCLMLAVQADGAALTTVEGLQNADGSLNDLQKAFQGQNLKNPTIGCLGSREFPSPVSSVHTRSNLSGWSSRCKGLQRLIGSTDRCQILRYVWYDT
jgi:carbon-monoxide dehydrogenase small subunit